jgi:hypothetical protein
MYTGLMALGRKISSAVVLVWEQTISFESFLLCCALSIKNITFIAFCVKEITASSTPTLIMLQARWLRNRDRGPAWPRNLPLVYSAQTDPGVHIASFSVCTGGLFFSAVNRPSSTEIKKAWSYASILKCLHGVVLNWARAEMYLLPVPQVTEPEGSSHY